MKIKGSDELDDGGYELDGYAFEDEIEDIGMTFQDFVSSMINGLEELKKINAYE